MKIIRTTIRNFRSIKSLEFFPSSVCVLVGENGAGKTNILAALNFLLGERWPSSRSLDISDYYNRDQNNSVFIGVEFAPNENDIRFLWFDQSLERGELRIQYCNKSESRFASNEDREKCALVYMGAERDLERHLGISRWTLFGRIINYFDSEFPDEMKTPLEQHFNEALNLLRTTGFSDFEKELTQAFADQLKRTRHQLRMSFRAFDPKSYYRSLQLLLERDSNELIYLNEAGQGMRNLVLLALFRAYAKIIRGDGILAIEEPDIFLHPHTQRSLRTLFRDLSALENLIFYSTHSSNFIELEQFDQICLVERSVDKDGELCTQIRQVSQDSLLKKRQELYPNITMNIEGIRRRYHHLCGLEHNEALFARKIVVVEGATEAYSLPIYAAHLGYDFDTYGVSVVDCGGKANLDQFYQLYSSFRIPTYLVFDNDRGGPDKNNLRYNRILLRMLDLPEQDEPNGIITETFAILEGNFEKEMKVSIGSQKWDELNKEAHEIMGQRAGKGIVPRFIAQKLAEEGIVPEFITEIIHAIKQMGGPKSDVNYDDIPF